MPRPALSASRSIDVIELLATFPDRRFSLSEIVAATNINIASCHAIVAALTSKGYLSRSATQKTYQLGPSLIGVGRSAQKSHAIVTLAERAGIDLRDDLGLPVSLSTLVGDEILAVLSVEDAAGREAGMTVGERLPLDAPLGAPFLAWASDEAISKWIGRSSVNDELKEHVYRDLELTRERGYQVTLRPDDGRSIGALMAEMARCDTLADYKDEVSRLIHSFDPKMWKPVELDEDRSYDVLMIAAPIFDEDGNAAFNLCLGEFPPRLRGGEVMRYADRLTQACLAIMRDHRAQVR